MKEIKICDTTLREGSQAPYINLSNPDKLRVLSIVQDLGIKIMELGFPISSDYETEFLESVFRNNVIKKDMEILLMCRALKEEIDYIKTILDKINVSPNKITLLIFTATSDSHLLHKLRNSLTKDKNPSLDELRQLNLSRVKEAIGYAHSCGFKVDFGIEDASRTSLRYLIEIIKLAKLSGAFRFTYADTVGVLYPEKTKEAIRKLRREFPKMELAVHFHNDRGLSLTNSLVAIDEGANVVHTTLNGIGERAGNTKFHELLAGLDAYNIFLKNINYEKVYPSCREFSSIIGIPINPIEPIIGDNVFTQKSGVHIHSFLKDRNTYQSVDPERFGRFPKIVFGPLSGKHSVEYLSEKLEEEGIRKGNGELLSFLKKSNKDFLLEDLIGVFKNE